MILKADQVVASSSRVLAPELYDRVRTAARARIGQTDRLHRTESQGIASAANQFLDGQAGFEVLDVVFRNMSRNVPSIQKGVDESIVLALIERAVQIVVGAVDRLAV